MRLIRKDDENMDELLFARLRRILPVHRKELKKEILCGQSQGERRSR